MNTTNTKDYLAQLYITHYRDAYNNLRNKLYSDAKTFAIREQYPFEEQIDEIMHTAYRHLVTSQELYNIAERLHIAREASLKGTPCLYGKNDNKSWGELYPKNLGYSNEEWIYHTVIVDEDFEYHHDIIPFKRCYDKAAQALLEFINDPIEE